MAKIKFKVSARAARLIGRENVATSQGAVTELVKNTYDADATVCALLFLRRWDAAPKIINDQQFIEIQKLFSDAEEFYPLLEGKRTLKNNLTDAQFNQLNLVLDNILDLWIVDNGHGMSAKTIEDHWMVIGTDVKEITETSLGGRVVTGAKGIGRFALDRLGQECELFSGLTNENQITHWYVDWGSFEGKGKVIDDVEALIEIEPRSILSAYASIGLDKFLPSEYPSRNDVNPNFNKESTLKFESGTAIRISSLHDQWDRRDSLKLKQTLEALLPPKERGDFNIYIYDHRAVEDSGWIDNFPPDQFDYRLQAKVAEDGVISIHLDRQEIDSSKIRPSVFDLKEMQQPGYSIDDFKRGFYSYKTDIQSLMKLKKGHDISEYLAIGPFDFVLYFFKLANPTEDNLKRYPQKNFDVSKRRQWLRNSGGIRLYRDGFRVRPYGEPNTQGSDWLLLGQRVAANPAAAKRLSWRVPPQQLAGTINITKAQNPLLADQSNREGIMNERVFAVFRDMILALIGAFERDRSYINYHFDKAYDIDNVQVAEIEEGKQLAKELLTGGGQISLNFDASKEQISSPEDSLKIAKAFESSEKMNESLKDDIQVMRGMATLGTVLVSFTHELKQIKANMESRSSRMEQALQLVVDQQKLTSLPKEVNPFNIVQRWNREDEKVSRWVDFALSAISPIKRRRRVINCIDYLDSLHKHWGQLLKSKQIDFQVQTNEKSLLVLAHEIDLDSIFYNLIVNSVEVFIQPSDSPTRNITIQVKKYLDSQIEIIYSDNGPGLSSEFNVANDIFIFGTSFKSNEDSSESGGTGIGMWLLKNIVDDYKGSVDLLCKIGEPNFAISIKLPLHFNNQGMK